MKQEDAQGAPSALEQRAKELAALHSCGPDPPAPLSVLQNLDRLPGWLQEVKRYCRAPPAEHVLAADWLLDNDYQVARAIRELRTDMPETFYSRLNTLKIPGESELPRVFALAHGFLDVPGTRLTMSAFIAYLDAYQETAILTTAELWALPSMLRLAGLELLAGGFAQIDSGLAPPFRLSCGAARDWQETPTDRIARAITALIAVRAIEWRVVVDRTSRVERWLGTDPAGVYAQMDFATRDRYRKAVEDLAAGADTSEEAICNAALKLAGTADAEPWMVHVGYWLIGGGRPVLEREMGYRPPAGRRLRRLILRHAGKIYGLALTLLAAAALAVPARYMASVGAGPGQFAGGLLLSILPATVLSVAILHWLIVRMFHPRVLPMMDFSEGLPAEFPTCIAVPIIVGDASHIPRIAEAMEIRRLSNPDPMLRFVVLADFADAPAETTPGDAALRDGLAEQIHLLNTRSGLVGHGPFVLMQRRRRYNDAEGCWMGWERKRGKLEQFNAFLLGGGLADFEFCEGDVEALQGTRFVITLDDDTSLPPGTANRLVGALAHPLNLPHVDPQLRRVVNGYSIIQPRIEVLPLKGPVSMFCRLYAGDTAIDIYSRAVSDVYQDMFGTGIFVGKGIYDVAAFHTCLEGRVPENTILSHDLFEGIHARAALASNIVLYEDFPSSYTEYAIRLNRWVRGDWQLLPWLGIKVPHGEGGRVPSDLSGLDRWKVIDNLRRSLLAPALLLFFLGGWMMLPGSAWLWTTLAVAAPGAYLLGELHALAAGESRRDWLGDLARRSGERVGRWFLVIVFLASDAMMSLDAIGRTIWRLTASRKRLLEWRSAAHVSVIIRGSSRRANAWRLMWPSTVFAAALATDLAAYDSSALLPAAPIIGLWIAAPEIAVWLGKPRHPRRETLGDRDRRFLLQVARRTWLYFETFAGPDDHWLPPDNFQSVPRNEIAHRTSPTNIGLFLASVQAAHDFGFIGASDLAARLRNALASIDKLETYRGHILNWYDTRTLAPLEPRYVSTVDSGNLAVALIALRQGLCGVAGGPAIRPQDWDGLSCTLDLLFAAIRQLPEGDGDALDRCEVRSRQLLAEAGSSQRNWHAVLRQFTETVVPEIEGLLTGRLAHGQLLQSRNLAEAHVWIERTRHHVRALIRELETLLPWLHLVAEVPEGLAAVADRVMQTFAPGLPMVAAADRDELISGLLGRSGEEGAGSDVQRQWLERLRQSLRDGLDAQGALLGDLDELSRRADILAYGMDFRLLYDPVIRLMRIGYNMSTGQPDPNHYDLLATEARLASYFAIAKHDLPVEHWFALGRPVTRFHGRPAILSWNGSMFEYLMPPLFLPRQRDTLLGESESMAVAHQRDYARQRGVPWGISESAFSATDADGNYQYRAFGAPGLGLRRGLTEDLVVAPYASALALCCWPAAAVSNMRDLEKLGALGLYGFYDSIDYTSGRVPEGKPFTIVRNFMAHHQGMTVVAAANALLDDVFVRRVLAEKRLETVELLLQERVPWDVPVETGRIDEQWHASEKEHTVAPLFPWVPSRSATVPQLQFLGNGRMASWLSASGAGCLLWQDVALTRWVPDPTRDDTGYWLYVRDEDSGESWSAGRQPTAAVSPDSKVVFHQHMVEFFRRDHGIAVRMEVAVSPGDDADIREVTVTNESGTARRLAFTSYAEVVLAPPNDDERHPAFSKLFVGSQHIAEHGALLFQRRPRRPELSPPVLLHMLVSDDPSITATGHETDRARFIGRLGSIRNPAALATGLSGATGWTLDPVMSLQTVLQLEPGETRRFAFVTIAAHSRQEAFDTAAHYVSLSLETVRRDAGRAATREVARLGIDPARLPELQVLASLLQMPHPGIRQVPGPVSGSMTSQPDLWQFGISGDFPILVLRIAGDMPSPHLELLVKAQQLWRRSGLRMDLVIFSFEAASYDAPLRERILGILREAGGFTHLGGAAGIHLLAAANLPADAVARICAAAHAVIEDSDATLTATLDRILEQRAAPPHFAPSGGPAFDAIAELERPAGLEFDNGIGGFDPGTGDYVIHLEAGQTTPAPWCNVLANDEFGTIVSDAGLGFTWAVNSGENRLTPWSNDPVCETPGEVVYLRDEATGEVWTPTPAPLGNDVACTIRHLAGSTVWRRNSHGFEQTLRALVPSEEPVKLVTLKLVNRTAVPRRVTATYYAEWLLGALASRSKPHVLCEYDATSRTILARNGWNPEFAGRVAFVTASLPPHSLTGSRYDFLGSEGDVARPAALRHWEMGERFVAGGDACAAYQVHLDIAPGAEVDVTFAIGQGADLGEALSLAEKWRAADAAEDALAAVEKCWARRLGAVRVRTPDRAFDILTNRWLVYQAYACRLQARAGFYQAGGAFGFRDQLQDVLALLMAEPERARRQILLAAARQFEEGDVQHWWHPPAGRGVRTRFSDDFIWLAYATARYVSATGDHAILAEEVPFLSAPPLKADEHDRYALFDTGRSAGLLEHCERALVRMMATGNHGLPLIGTGDWNDGMDRIGAKGRGESVWLAWFQIVTIDLISPLLAGHDRKELAEELQRYSTGLKRAVDDHGWDGSWFLRAFDDDGLPWGSETNDECQIDAIAQSWSVLASNPPDARARAAMASVQQRLVDTQHRLVKLLEPPFSASPRDPGYIKAYPPGIRENGGQYTHAAAWTGHALAALGDGDAAWQVFDIINPIRRAQTADGARHYAREPYVLPGDVSGMGADAGRGGWSWYTGAASWTWQLAVEAILGIRLADGALTIQPCLPRDWKQAEVSIGGPNGTVDIIIEDPDGLGCGEVEITVDGRRRKTPHAIAFPGAGNIRKVSVRLARPSRYPSPGAGSMRKDARGRQLKAGA